MLETPMISSVHSIPALGFPLFLSGFHAAATQQPGDQVASVEFGELVTFTPFPKRSAPWTNKQVHVDTVGLMSCVFLFMEQPQPCSKDSVSRIW